MPFYHEPHPWNPGYAIPRYVLAEPPGRGTFTTEGLPRRTISEIRPDYLAKPMKKKLYGRKAYGMEGVGDDARRYVLVPTGQEEDPSMPPKKEMPGWVIPAALVGAAVYLMR